MTKLLPCPFCGGGEVFQCWPTCEPDEEVHRKDHAYPTVECTGCRAEVRGDVGDNTALTAIEHWNRRADTAENAKLKARVAELESLCRAVLKRFKGVFEQGNHVDISLEGKLKAALAKQEDR